MHPDPLGYSGTALPRKLGIAPGSRVAALAAPPGFVDRLDGAPTHSLVRGEPFDVIVQFATTRSTLERRLDTLIAALAPRGGLWIAWPKRASGVATDLSEHVVRDRVLRTGLVDNKVCAIDETWSALRFVRRR